MKAITTKYIGPTNFRGSRYKAFDGDGNSITIGADDRLNYGELHQAAAKALCEKMGWEGEMVGGWCGNVMVWCWTKSHERFLYTKPAQPYQPKTGAKCSCRPGVQRDNCPTCEGTGWVIDFAAIRARA